MQLEGLKPETAKEEEAPSPTYTFKTMQPKTGKGKSLMKSHIMLLSPSQHQISIWGRNLWALIKHPWVMETRHHFTSQGCKIGKWGSQRWRLKSPGTEDGALSSRVRDNIQQAQAYLMKQISLIINKGIAWNYNNLPDPIPMIEWIEEWAPTPTMPVRQLQDSQAETITIMELEWVASVALQVEATLEAISWHNHKLLMDTKSLLAIRFRSIIQSLYIMFTLPSNPRELAWIFKRS